MERHADFAVAVTQRLWIESDHDRPTRRARSRAGRSRSAGGWTSRAASRPAIPSACSTSWSTRRSRDPSGWRRAG